jgi:hypothetical protein
LFLFFTTIFLQQVKKSIAQQTLTTVFFYYHNAQYGCKTTATKMNKCHDYVNETVNAEFKKNHVQHIGVTMKLNFWLKVNTDNTPCIVIAKPLPRMLQQMDKLVQQVTHQSMRDALEPCISTIQF